MTHKWLFVHILNSHHNFLGLPLNNVLLIIDWQRLLLLIKIYIYYLPTRQRVAEHDNLLGFSGLLRCSIIHI